MGKEKAHKHKFVDEPAQVLLHGWIDGVASRCECGVLSRRLLLASGIVGSEDEPTPKPGEAV